MRRCFIFVDESGDLGYRKGSSEFFTLAALATDDRRLVERIPKRIRRGRLKKSMRKKPELKFHDSSPDVKRSVLRMAASLGNTRFVSMTVSKREVRNVVLSDRDGFYLSCLCRLILEIAMNEQAWGALHIVVDARPAGRAAGRNFDEHLATMIQKGLLALNKPAPLIRVSRLDSQSSPGLQVVDFIAGGVKRKYELGDARYFDIIASRLTELG